VDARTPVSMINLHGLRVFLEVARTRNFSRAAEELGVTQPAVSAQVRRLEKDLGVRLFWQSGRSTYLTEAGEALQTYAERLVALAAEARATISEFADLKRGHLRLAATTTPGTYLLPQLLGEFRREWPQLEISLSVGNHAFVVSQLEGFHADLALVAGAIRRHPALTSSKLMQDDLLLIAGAASELATRSDLLPSDLRTERFFLREKGSGTLDVVTTRLRPARVRLDNVIELPSTEAIKQAVMAGLGYAIVSRLAIERETRRGDLVIVPAPWLNLRREIHLVFHRSKFMSPMMRRFIQLIEAKLDDHRDVASTG
jgi:DNA-binding transcriptional LysR family regulator